MKKTMILFMVGALAFLLGATSALAIVPEGSSTLTFQGQDSTYSTTVDTLVAQGGNITNVSINQTVQSSYWQAFYGQVVKTILLAQDVSNIVYNWGSQDLNGWIYFANDSGVNWNTLEAGDAADRTNEDATLGLTGDAESVTNTFTLNSHNQITSFNSTGGNITADAAVGVNTTSANDGAAWSTILLRDGSAASDVAVYAGEVNAGGARQNYRGEVVDYQIMVPVLQGTGLRTYNVYAGLN